MKRRTIYTLLILYVLFFCSAGSLYPQKTDTKDSSKSRTNFFKPEVSPWGRIKLMMIESNNNIGITDAGSRLGVKVNQNLNNEITLFGGIELSMFITSGGDFRVSPDNSSNTGYINIVNVPNSGVFGLRKGYVGADFKKYGRVSIGKQYGAYYEVAGITDISENNSGYASYVYSPDGSDGGSTGTGRASNSLLYKNTLYNFDVAVSGQFKLSEKEFSKVFNSFGASLIYKFPLNINAGIAYNEVFLSSDLESHLRGLKSNPLYSSIGINYTTEKLFFGVNYAYQESGDLEQVKDSTVMYSGYGIEIAAMWKPFNRWIILGGVNYKQPHNVDELINKEFKRLVYFYGLQFLPFDNLSFYLEGAYDRSVTSTGDGIPSNISSGVKFVF
ncbi:MAG: porin [Ignavibacteria bacterium]